MVNCNSHSHSLVDAPAWRPKSKQWKRRNKARAKAASVTLHEGIKAAIAQGNN